MPKDNKVQIWVAVTPAQRRALNELSRVTRIPRTVLLREAVDDLLRKYKKRLTRG
jgi:hypothetical protein